MEIGPVVEISLFRGTDPVVSLTYVYFQCSMTIEKEILMHLPKYSGDKMSEKHSYAHPAVLVILRIEFDVCFDI